jgi:hypothetical protein
MESVTFGCKNGLGDKLLDLIGAYVICKTLKYKLNLCLNSGKKVFRWGHTTYDERLFHFNDMEQNQPKSNLYIESINPSSSLCPYNVYKYLSANKSEITFEDICVMYKKYASQIIQPSEIILNRIPSDMSNVYGIHLRKTDKINNHRNNSHENTQSEFDTITQKLLDTVVDINRTDECPSFLIVSEDNEWKKEMEEKISTLCDRANIIKLDYRNDEQYDNFESVLDLFCLSKCKQIIQGVKYSTFSMIASLIGNVRLVNFSDVLASRDNCLIHNWSSVLDTNIKLEMDNVIHVASCVNGVKTNIICDYNI